MLCCGEGWLSKTEIVWLLSPRCTLGIAPKYIPFISVTEGYLLWWNYKSKEPENDYEALEV